MRVIEDFPFQIEIHDDIRIPMADGVHLAARIWRPARSKRHLFRRSSRDRVDLIAYFKGAAQCRR